MFNLEFPMAALLLSAMLLPACSSDNGMADPPIDRVFLSGDVSDGEGPVSALQFAFHARKTTYPVATATSGTFRLELPRGEYDVRIAPAPPSIGDPQHIQRVVFDEAGEQTLYLSLATVRLTLSVPAELEGGSIEAGLYWNATRIALQQSIVREGQAEMLFRALVSVQVLVAVNVSGREEVYFAPGVTEPVPESYLVLQAGVTADMSFALPD